MPRGQVAKDGDENTSANGYHYKRVNGEWRLKHHLVAEAKLGRKIDTTKEVVRFKDKDKNNLHPDNIEVILKNKASVRARLAVVRAKIAEYKGQEADLLRELGKS